MSARGADTPEDPIRMIYQYWSKEGELLAEYDTLYPYPDLQNFPIHKDTKAEFEKSVREQEYERIFHTREFQEWHSKKLSLTSDKTT
jgi:hypothetical protein